MVIVAESSSVDILGVILWSAALLAILIVGMLLALRLKRRMKAEDNDAPAAAAGFTLSDLRSMHRAGQLTDEEFAKAKEKVLLAAKKAAERVPAVAGDSPDAIRARRMAREAGQQTEVDDGGESREGGDRNAPGR